LPSSVQNNHDRLDISLNVPPLELDLELGGFTEEAFDGLELQTTIKMSAQVTKGKMMLLLILTGAPGCNGVTSYR
jgi:hypothetical protein